MVHYLMTSISYTVQTHPRARYLKLKVLSNGDVVVVKPKYGWILKNLDQFVNENRDWIERTRAKLQSKKAIPAHNNNELQIFGKTYTKKVSFSNKKPIGVSIFDQEIIVNPVTESTTSVERSLQQFLKTTAEKYIVPRTHQLAEKMKISFRAITLRNQKTRWGSCSSHGNLNFNWRLVHCPPEVIDYVIVHELAHRQHMNHSGRFWEVVRRFDPEHLKHRGWLKRQGMDLG